MCTQGVLDRKSKFKWVAITKSRLTHHWLGVFYFVFFAYRLASQPLLSLLKEFPCQTFSVLFTQSNQSVSCHLHSDISTTLALAGRYLAYSHCEANFSSFCSGTLAFVRHSLAGSHSLPSVLDPFAVQL